MVRLVLNKPNTFNLNVFFQTDEILNNAKIYRDKVGSYALNCEKIIEEKPCSRLKGTYLH